MSDEAAIDWFKRENEVLRSALAASQEREVGLREALTEKCRDIGMLLGMSKDGDWEEWKRLADKCEQMPVLSTPSDAGRGGQIDDETFRLLRSCEGEISLLVARCDYAGEAEHLRFLDLQKRLLSTLGFKEPSVKPPATKKLTLRQAANLPITHQPPPASGEESLG